MGKSPTIVGVVIAGRSPNEDDPLIEYTHGRPKAMILIAGKPMITYVVDAMIESRYLKQVIVVGLSDKCANAVWPDDAPIELLPDTGDILANAKSGVQRAQSRRSDLDGVLLSSCDVPTITPAIINAFIEECLDTDHDLYYSIIERGVMEARFPGAGRSYVHLREGDFAGGDLVLTRSAAIFSQEELWQKLAQTRKHALRQASTFGLWPLFKLLIHRLSLDEAESRASEAFGLRGRAVPFPYAEVGMDVDKPFQLEIVRADLKARFPAS